MVQGNYVLLSEICVQCKNPLNARFYPCVVTLVCLQITEVNGKENVAPIINFKVPELGELVRAIVHWGSSSSFTPIAIKLIMENGCTKMIKVKYLWYYLQTYLKSIHQSKINFRQLNEYIVHI